MIMLLRLIAWFTKPTWAGDFVRTYWDWKHWSLHPFFFGWKKLTPDEEREYPHIAKAAFKFGPLDLDYTDGP